MNLPWRRRPERRGPVPSREEQFPDGAPEPHTVIPHHLVKLAAELDRFTPEERAALAASHTGEDFGVNGWWARWAETRPGGWEGMKGLCSVALELKDHGADVLDALMVIEMERERAGFACVEA